MSSLTRVSYFRRADGARAGRYRLYVFAWSGGCATGSALHDSGWLAAPTDAQHLERVDYAVSPGVSVTPGNQYVVLLAAVDPSAQYDTAGQA